LSSEIGIGMVLFNGVENRWLESWERFFFTSFLAASAANEGGVRLRNPAGSNVMVVIERVEISELLPDNPGFAFGTATADLGTVGQGAPLDTRGRTQPTSIPSSQNTAPTVPALTGAATLSRPFIAANTPYFFISDEGQELTVLPGSAIQINANTVNQGLSVALLWRERSLEESERF